VGPHISSPVSFILKTGSEVIVNPGFLHDLVRHVPGLYFPVNGHFDSGGGFGPYIMIALAVMVKSKSVPFQDFPDFLFILRH
jgi:hypothetical protein